MSVNLSHFMTDDGLAITAFWITPPKQGRQVPVKKEVLLDKI